MFSELGSLLLITGQQTASQGHEQCVVAEQRAFSPESVRLSARKRKGRRDTEKKRKREKEREREDCMLWALIAAARLGTMSAQALSSDKERESISCQWAWRRGTDWCFFMEPACPHKLGQLTPNTNRMGGTRQLSNGFHMSLPFACKLPSSPDSLCPFPLTTKATTWTKSVAAQRSEQWPMD